MTKLVSSLPPTLDRLLDQLGENTEKVWQSIFDHNGSVQHLYFLSEEQKRCFRTALEIDLKVKDLTHD